MFAGSLRVGSGSEELSSDFGSASGESVSNKSLSQGICTRPGRNVYYQYFLLSRGCIVIEGKKNKPISKCSLRFSHQCK